MDIHKEMGTGSIPRLLLKFSLPAITAMLVHSLYNVADSIFVGRGVGELALAGVTVSFPIMIILMALTMLISMGATTLISIRLGEKKGEEAEEIIGNAIILFLIVGVSLSVLGLIFIKPLLVMFGASPNVLPYATDYMKILIPGSVLVTVGVGMNNFIRAEGNPKTAMYTMLIGSITNIILDYVFIFIFHWGIKGAAIATVISYALSCAWVLNYFLSGNSYLKIRVKNFKLKGDLVKGIAAIGFPAFAMQATSSIQNLILNRSLVYYGGDLALAAVGILISVATLIVTPVLGISQGAQPIIGFNYGARQLQRVKATLKTAIAAATVIVVMGFMVSRIWPAELIGLFNRNPELIKMGTHAMLIFFILLPLEGLQIVGAGYFQAVGKPVQATILSLSRQVIIFIPLVFILPRFWSLDGVWWSSPLSDFGAFVLTFIWLRYEFKYVLNARKNKSSL